MANTAHRVARGVAWTYGTQVATALLQIIYASFTSRLVGPEGFGQYGIALTATALFSLLATGGLSQTISRLHTVSKEKVSGILAYALVLAALTTVLTILLAKPWALLWHSPGSAPVLVVLSINAATSPIYGVVTGLMLRLGDYRPLAILTFITNVAGMIAGVLAVAEWHSAASLTVSAIFSQATLTLIATIYTRKYLTLRSARGNLETLGFSTRLVVAQVIQYMTGNVTRWGTSIAVGPPALGQWNRAEVLAVLPFQQLQGALIPVIYPEFRHDRDNATRSRNLWPDLVAMVAWVTIPVGVAAAALLPAALPFLFGTRWSDAGLYAIPLALAGGMQPAAILLASAVEALGRFRVIWTVSAVLLVAQFALASLVFETRSIWPALCGQLVINVGSLVGYSVWAHRAGRLDGRRLFAHAARIAMFSATVALTLGAVSFGIRAKCDWVAITGGVLTIVECAIIARYWRALPPIKLARSLGLSVGRPHGPNGDYVDRPAPDAPRN